MEEIPRAWFPSRRSEAIATHSFPTMAITEPPLYSMIDYSSEYESKHSTNPKVIAFLTISGSR